MLKKIDCVMVYTHHLPDAALFYQEVFGLRQIWQDAIERVKALAPAQGCKRLFLSTTNDNLEALAFYQKRGFRLIRVCPNAVDEARRLKPSIPLVAGNGIAIRDELELELR